MSTPADKLVKALEMAEIILTAHPLARLDKYLREALEWHITPALAEYRAAPQGWQPIETAPKDGTEIWLWHRDYYKRRPIIGYWHEERDKFSTGLAKQPSHWAPAPYPPVPGDQP